MKLSKLYSNRPRQFAPIVFNNTLNVVYAKVTRPKDSNKDSHNLGKTLLIGLIDFTLLCGVAKGHFLYDHADIFEDFEFFLEVELNDGGYLTIRRAVKQVSKASFITHDSPDEDFSSVDSAHWTHDQLPFKKAREKLNSLLDLSAVAPWDYRKGVSYFLRTQADYQDVFQISKFSKGKHADWKPYLATVLGFPRELIQKKYSIDDAIEKKKAYRATLSQELQVDLTEYDRIKGMIEIKRKEVDTAKDEADKFDFFKNELQLNEGLVRDIETSIANLNEELYEAKYEAEKIRDAVKQKIKFDLDKVKELFADMQVYFSKQLTKDYLELVGFNQRLSEERNRRLHDRLNELVSVEASCKKQLSKLNTDREQILSVLQSRDTFVKFRALQSSVVEKEVEIAKLQAELESLDAMSRIDREIRSLTQQRQEVVNLIEDKINSGNSRYSSIRQRFNEIIRDVVNLPAIVSTSVNAEGNLDFEATLIQNEKTMHATSEGKGTTYKKLLCAAFDISVLESYESESFYRFVYHDGILEGLDNRKKERFLEVVNEFCDEYGLQYILTVIDADLPRNEKDEKLKFDDGVVIRELHERDASGRLFNMPKF